MWMRFMSGLLWCGRIGHASRGSVTGRGGNVTDVKKGSGPFSGKRVLTPFPAGAIIGDMAKHIGIAACSAEGAALCYRTICTEGAELVGAAHAHPEVSMHTPSLADYMGRIYRGDWQAVGELMLESAHKLAKMGADFLICPDNTIHQAL